MGAILPTRTGRWFRCEGNNVNIIHIQPGYHKRRSRRTIVATAVRCHLHVCGATIWNVANMHQLRVHVTARERAFLTCPSLICEKSDHHNCFSSQELSRQPIGAKVATSTQVCKANTNATQHRIWDVYLRGVYPGRIAAGRPLSRHP